MNVNPVCTWLDKMITVKFRPEMTPSKFKSIYFVVDTKKDELLYIGKTTIPEIRIRFHNHRGESRAFYVRAVSDNLNLNELEDIYIYQLIALD